MGVERIVIERREPLAEGREFGAAGPYERLSGTFQFAVDPNDPANAAIVDLDRAERGSDGRVRFSADFNLLQPKDPAHGNRRLLVQVVNRGRFGTVPFSVAPPQTAIDDRIDPGDGFLLQRGWTILQAGWQWDVIRRPGYLGLEAPQALDESGRPIQGPTLVRFQPSEPYRYQSLAHWPLHPAPGNLDFQHRAYPAADAYDPDAVLTMRDSDADARTIVSRDRWRFAREENGRVIPDDSHIWLADSFVPGKIYEVVYRTRACPVVGSGLLAIRDAASFLRYGGATEGNPAGPIDRAIAFGVSQCGRFLREFLYQGLNLDERGRIVFDGVFAHVAGARRGEFNHRYAQPSAQHALGFGHLPPFADDPQADPVAGPIDGLLSRQRRLGGVPRVFHVNTSSEYWRSDCSLVHTDPTGTRDLEPPAEARVYLFAGAQHGPGALPLTRQTPSGARTANPLNTVNFTPLLRAALINLEQWVADGVEPPPSAFPRLSDGTAVPRPNVLEAFSRVPGAALLAVDRLPTLRRIENLGTEAGKGIGSFPPSTGAPYSSYVSAVDADGNEVAGIRLPDLTVPLASHTGWNPRDPTTGGAGQLVDMQGSTLPFAPTEAERERAGDPRTSIAERYASREDYLARVRAAAQVLVAARHLLPEDIDLVVELAASRFDAFAVRK